MQNRIKFICLLLGLMVTKSSTDLFPNECRWKLTCTFRSIHGQFLHVKDFDRFENLRKIYDLQSNSTLMDHFLSWGNEFLTIPVHQIYVNNRIYMRIGKTFEFYKIDDVFPGPTEYRSSESSENNQTSLGEFLTDHCTNSTNPKLLRIHAANLQDLKFSETDEIGRDCIDNVRSIVITDTHISGSDYFFDYFRNLLRVHFANVTFANRKIAYKIIAYFDFAKLFRFERTELEPDSIEYMIFDLTELNEIETDETFYWPYSNDFIELFDKRNRCMHSVFVHEFAMTAKPEQCLDDARRLDDVDELASVHAYGNYRTFIIALIVFLVIFVPFLLGFLLLKLSKKSTLFNCYKGKSNSRDRKTRSVTELVSYDREMYY